MSENIRLRVAPCHIHYLNRIMEGYEYLGTVTTVDRLEGIVAIRVTPDTGAEVRAILKELPFPCVFL